MRLILAVAAAMFLGSTAGAQDVSVPSVTTASPGGYANPLKLDTDRYDRKKRKTTRRPPAPFGRCNERPLTANQRAQLETGYLTRARGNSQRGWRWLSEQCGPTSASNIERSAKRRAAREKAR